MGEGETVSVEVSRNGIGQIENEDESLIEKREIGKEDVVKEKEKDESMSAKKTAVSEAVGNEIGQTEDIILTEKKDKGQNEVKEMVDNDKIENEKKDCVEENDDKEENKEEEEEEEEEEEGQKQVVKADEEAHVKEGKGKEAEQVEAATPTKADRENDAVEEESEKEDQEKATETVALGKENATLEEKSEKAGKRAEVSNYENPKVAEEVKQPKKRVILKRCERKAEAEKLEVGEKRTNEPVTYIAFSTDRHVRVRKSVERFVAAVEPEPIREFRFEKGRGTALKDIPNVKSLAKKEASRKSELKKTRTPRKATTVSSPRKHSTRSTSKHSKVESSRVHTLVACSSKEKDVETAKRKRSAPLKVATNMSTHKEKAGKKLVKGKDERSKGLSPSEDELRCTIAQILHEVDFNTATFILKKLAAHYGMDFTPRKGELKRKTKEELMKLGDEEEETEEEDEGESEKEDAPKAAVKRMKT